MCMGCILSFFIVERYPVPNEGACDWGLKRFLSPVSPICEICKLYHDGRTDSVFSMQDCVWVREKGKCYPKNYAVNKNLDYDETCEGFNFYFFSIPVWFCKYIFEFWLYCNLFLSLIIDPCACETDPCNGNTCIAVVGAITCDCSTTGFTGDRCETSNADFA